MLNFTEQLLRHTEDPAVAELLLDVLPPSRSDDYYWLATPLSRAATLRLVRTGGLQKAVTAVRACTDPTVLDELARTETRRTVLRHLLAAGHAAPATAQFLLTQALTEAPVHEALASQACFALTGTELLATLGECWPDPATLAGARWLHVPAPADVAEVRAYLASGIPAFADPAWRALAAGRIDGLGPQAACALALAAGVDPAGYGHAILATTSYDDPRVVDAELAAVLATCLADAPTVDLTAANLELTAEAVEILAVLAPIGLAAHRAATTTRDQATLVATGDPATVRAYIEAMASVEDVTALLDGLTARALDPTVEPLADHWRYRGGLLTLLRERHPAQEPARPAVLDHLAALLRLGSFELTGRLCELADLRDDQADLNVALAAAFTELCDEPGTAFTVPTDDERRAGHLEARTRYQVAHWLATYGPDTAETRTLHDRYLATVHGFAAQSTEQPPTEWGWAWVQTTLAPLGADPLAWQAFLQLVAEYPGTLPELVRTTRGMLA